MHFIQYTQANNHINLYKRYKSISNQLLCELSPIHERKEKNVSPKINIFRTKCNLQMKTLRIFYEAKI